MSNVGLPLLPSPVETTSRFVVPVSVRLATVPAAGVGDHAGRAARDQRVNRLEGRADAELRAREGDVGPVGRVDRVPLARLDPRLRVADAMLEIAPVWV
jgi:hypothetical protein